ncbi:MAG: iron-containing alcohol dehydrogenase family protein [Erysipelotrichaceae bacterium]|nr:iron-containing alcohol dehydrogenase family protein [Erysipelotrichaceae bacterium]MBR3352792.1 iron-containing alcohol dehydrogenase family protein [Erysipelotrichaceae bacterium]
MNSYYLPCYTIGTDAFENFESVMSFYGRKVALLYGEKAFKASKDKVLPALKNFDIIYQTVYGKEASYANIDRLAAVEQISRADLILAVGGGKCLDVAKVVGDKLGKPVFTVASIASTCAAVTRIAVLHNDDGSFREVYRLTNPPVHCFIDPEIIVNAPARYFWAGMGDTMAKHVECVFSSKNDVLDFESALGRTISVLCYDPILEKGEKAYDDVKNHVVSGEVEDVIKSIIIATGAVSLSVNPDYNSALAHALYYGLTVREWMEQKHLHGEIVSYGTLAQLLIDGQMEELRKVYDFNKAVKLPVCLKDLDLDRDDPMDDILDATIINPELNHIPYPITKEMVRETILKLEDYK